MAFQAQSKIPRILATLYTLDIILTTVPLCPSTTDHGLRAQTSPQVPDSSGLQNVAVFIRMFYDMCVHYGAVGTSFVS